LLALLAPAWQGLRAGVRLCRRQPSHGGIIALTLGFGIASTAVTYSVLAGTVLQELPFEDASRLVSIRVVDRTSASPGEIPLALFLRWQGSSESFERLAAYTEYMAFVSLEEIGTAVYPAAGVTTGFFDVLRVRPVLGRGFNEADLNQGAPRVAIISYQVWKRDLKSDSEVIGRSVRIHGEAATIVGVLPNGVEFPSRQGIWVAMRTGGVLPGNAGDLGVIPIGRLKEGASPEAARSELVALASAAADRELSAAERPAILVEPFASARTDARLRASLIPMIFAMTAILVLACANVTNLVLAKAESERQAIAVRAALGASRTQIAVATAFEILALSLVGGVAALPLTILGVWAFNHFMAPSRFFLASWVGVEIDVRILGLLVLAAVGSGLLAGSLPAVRRSMTPPGEALGAGGRQLGLVRPGFWNRALMTLEIALAAGLLFVAGVLVRNVAQLRQVDLGVEGAGVVTAKVSTFHAQDLDESETLRFFAELGRRLEALPAVETVAYTTSLPTEGSFWREVAITGQQDPVRARWLVVSPGFFEALDVRVLRGRDFRAGEPGRGSAEVIVNRSFAERYLGAEALDGRLRPIDPEPSERWLSVVGVVEDYVMAPLGEESSGPAIFTPLHQGVHSSIELVARPRPGLSIPASAVCLEAVAVHPEAACFDVRHLADLLSRRVWIYDALAALFSSLGSLSLVLGTTGAFGVMSFLVGRRRREMGVRFALGATRRSIEGLVFRQFAPPAAIGLTLGLMAGVLCTRLLASLLHGVKTYDPAVILLTIVALLVPSAIAVHRPARRAGRVDPMTSLRPE
jgi:predicted permease